ncbi:polysaccharide deacetylase family protein [Paenibacillus sp. FSL R7-0312]|uniref:polysaccharide deacetylase family protein n=1 Tax=unclassified Paenibacillus TaxID=185978 RepID=UPI0006937AF3|nr:polysaccharide deacetylase family protein [Paenibacillus sp. FSL R5-0912]
MPVHPAIAARMVELLSLEQRQGVYQMEVGLTHSSGSARQILFIDEYTYVQLSMLGPFAGQRVRLSLYPKWDPFRRSFFSSLIKMNQTFSETLYYGCSEEYASQLVKARQEEERPAEPGPAAHVPSLELHHHKPGHVRRSRSLRPARAILLRGILFSCLIALFLLRMDGKLFSSSAEAHEDPVQSAVAASVQSAVAADVSSSPLINVIPAVQTVAYQSSEVPAVPEEAPEDTPEDTSAAAPETAVEEIELDGNSYEYSLPQGYVALSFDDGPSQYTRQIVDILDEYGVAANFLFIGQKASRRPAEVRYANEHGMPVGSHSWDHSDMTRNSPEENRKNLERASRELESNMNSAVTIFRPPYGAVNDELAAEAKRQHMKLLLWNRDTEDWKADNAPQVLRYFHTTDPSGGIYLLHEKAVTVQALPEIIEYLQAQGLKFAVFK